MPELSSPAPIPDTGFPGGGRRASEGAYVVAVLITALAIYSQYIVPERVAALGEYGNFALGLGIVYGIPIVACALLLGRFPISRYVQNGVRAAVEGLRWYGLLSLLAFFVLLVLAIVYAALAPDVLPQLNRPNPVLEAARGDPWFWVGFSFVIGFLEETIFRGWIFGYWLARGTRNWFFHAVWTSLFFVGVHVYYGTTYGLAAPFAFSQLFLGGLAFAVAFRYSGGNLVVISLLHGANDALAFLTLVSVPGATALRWLVIGVGLLIALVLYLQARSPAPPQVFLPPGAMPYGWPGAADAQPPFAWPVGSPAPPPPPPPPPDNIPPPGS